MAVAGSPWRWDAFATFVSSPFFSQRCGIFISFYFFLGRFDGLLRERVGNGEKKKHVSVCVCGKRNGGEGSGVEWRGRQGGERIF